MVNFNIMENNLLNRITSFIYDQGLGYTLPWPLSFTKKEINIETSLERDLNITGDDADEFLLAFGREFNVNVSQFPIGEYFGDEGEPILPAIFRFLTNRKKRSRKSLTVGHLEKAIIAGRLDEEVINGSNG